MKPAVLLIQLGTPDAPEPAAVRRYLREFLSDPLVVQLPRWLWLPILYGPILRARPPRTAALYRSIWMDMGSPLSVYSSALAQALEQELALPVALGMRYGNPRLVDAVASLRARGATDLLVLPLFPQYSRSTSESAWIAARKAAGDMNLHLVDSYATHPAYLRALAATIERERATRGEPERWLLSFHGIPKAQAKRGDPYAAQCEATALALAELARLPAGRWEFSFQSRFGPQPWLQPYTDRRLEELGAERIASLAVLCPGFAADCLETLEEIGVRGREGFQHAGGGELRLVPCLNAQPPWVAALAEIVREALSSWANEEHG